MFAASMVALAVSGNCSSKFGSVAKNILTTITSGGKDLYDLNIWCGQKVFATLAFGASR
jgi:hypothetical protein